MANYSCSDGQHVLPFKDSEWALVRIANDTHARPENQSSPWDIFIIRESPYKIGRDREAHCSILDRSISRNHCELSFESDGTWLIDNFSTNSSTFVNGRSIGAQERMYIKVGDTIQIGDNPFFKYKLTKVSSPVQHGEDFGLTLNEVMMTLQNLASFKSHEASIHQRFQEIHQVLVTLPDKLSNIQREKKATLEQLYLIQQQEQEVETHLTEYSQELALLLDNMKQLRISIKRESNQVPTIQCSLSNLLRATFTEEVAAVDELVQAFAALSVT
ncbi:hypothetical protein QAD02_018461 [Eretmocerus hayati]|uniref:Uncharacterized protein n=1 Tax=Eretmocerus hayati TaxID=131215 RepID=A0ACC2PJ87_9HYME|nr:hypothetical protein QAD02_018461 [Eretmocerus hayati]